MPRISQLWIFKRFQSSIRQSSSWSSGVPANGPQVREVIAPQPGGLIAKGFAATEIQKRLNRPFEILPPVDQKVKELFDQGQEAQAEIPGQRFQSESRVRLAPGHGLHGLGLGP